MTDQARVLEKAVAASESLTGTQLTGNRQTMLTIPRRTSAESWPSSPQCPEAFALLAGCKLEDLPVSSKTGFPMRLTPATMGD